MGHATDTDRPAHLKHYFHTEEQQASAGKLGMWLFLGQEMLFFSGLFMGYIICRYFYPETFMDAYKHLSIPMGALNTVVLITSSLTMALAVRAAQTDEQAKLFRKLLAMKLNSFHQKQMIIDHIIYRPKKLNLN